MNIDDIEPCFIQQFPEFIWSEVLMPRFFSLNVANQAMRIVDVPLHICSLTISQRIPPTMESWKSELQIPKVHPRKGMLLRDRHDEESVRNEGITERLEKRALVCNVLKHIKQGNGAKSAFGNHSFEISQGVLKVHQLHAPN